MIINMTGGGGGSKTSITVVGGTTKPPSPNERTVWLNTAIAIPSFEISFSKPSSPKEGTVWIELGYTSNVDLPADEEHSIILHPVSAYQYTNGAWVSNRDAAAYYDEAWHDLRYYLVYNGSQRVDFSKTSYAGDLTFGDNYMGVKTKNAGGYSFYVYTTSPTDVTRYSRLCVEVLAGSTVKDRSSGVPAMGISNSKPGTSSVTYDKSLYYGPTTGTNAVVDVPAGIYKLDILGSMGERYVEVMHMVSTTSSGQAELMIRDAWLE